MLVQVMPGVLIRATGIVTTGRIAAPASLPGADARPVSFTAKAMTVHDPQVTVRPRPKADADDRYCR